MSENQFYELESKLGYRFKEQRYLEEALTHRSYRFEHQDKQQVDNERLEFVGDAILGLCAADYLFSMPGQYPEGEMSKIRAAVVCEPTLGDVARSLNLGSYLRLGRGEEKSGGSDKDSNLSNAMEAVFAAVYLDGGFEAAKAVILTILMPFFDLALSGHLLKDYKTSLLELAQALPELPPLEFVITGESGPVHDRLFTAEVRLEGQVLGTGEGKSKKQAEQQAAKAALAKIRADFAR